MLARTRDRASAPVPVKRSRRHTAPSMLKSASRVDGETEAASSAAPPTALLLMMLMPLVGGTPLPVPKSCAAAVARERRGDAAPRASPPKL